MAAAVGVTAVCRVAVQGAALAAEVRSRPPSGSRRLPSVGLFEQPIRDDQPRAAFGRGRGPNGVLYAVLVLGGIAVLKPAKLVPGAATEFQVLIVFLEEMLPAIAAGQDREERAIVPAAVASFPSLRDRNRSTVGAAAVPSRATTISSRPRRKK